MFCGDQTRPTFLPSKISELSRSQNSHLVKILQSKILKHLFWVLIQIFQPHNSYVGKENYSAAFFAQFCHASILHQTGGIQLTKIGLYQLVFKPNRYNFAFQSTFALKPIFVEAEKNIHSFLDIFYSIHYTDECFRCKDRKLPACSIFFFLSCFSAYFHEPQETFYRPTQKKIPRYSKRVSSRCLSNDCINRFLTVLNNF